MILKIKVKPGSGKQEITKISNEGYTISLKQKAEDNKANIELIKLLKKYLKVNSNNLNIIKGLRSRNKIIEVK